jgi:flagellar motility protein MotE (MotC chaperone)
VFHVAINGSPSMKSLAVPLLTRLLILALCVFAINAATAAENAGAESAAAVATAAPPAAAAPNEPQDNASLYCRNIANAAADARYARQTAALTALEKELDDRIAKLEKKQAEYQEWVQRREDFLAKADDAVVAIYSQMRPDAAAQQIAVMDEEAAAAILAKVTPRTASAILNEMDATAAAHLTNVMAGLPAQTKKAPNPS